MKLNETHLELMLDLRNRTYRYTQLGAKRAVIFLKLKEIGLTKLDEEEYILNSEKGDRVLDIVVECFNDVGNTE